jgi:hypothetical protein
MSLSVLIGLLLGTPVRSNFAGQFGLAAAISVCLYLIYLYIKARSEKREPGARG